MAQMIEELSCYFRGWRGYFGYCGTPSVLKQLDSWVRRRVPRAFWWQWKTRHGRQTGAAARDVGSR